MLLGTYSIGTIVPMLLQAELALGASKEQLQAKIDGLISLQGKVALAPPTFDAAAVLEFATAIDAAISVGLPTATVDASALLSLQAELGALNAMLAVTAVLGVSGVHLYMVTGTAPDMGAQLNADLAPGFPGGLPESSGIGFLLAASSGPAKAALKTIITIR